MRGHIWFFGLNSVHPGQMVNEINFKFDKDLKGIKIILVPCNVVILDILNKTVKTDIFIDVISRNIHSITLVSTSHCQPPFCTELHKIQLTNQASIYLSAYIYTYICCLLGDHSFSDHFHLP